ncbi:MAG: putative transporter, ATP-binding component [Rhodocyclales bacterium]|nr:putative transporter, ATP-binding component [Rhodocyclales bacterium]
MSSNIAIQVDALSKCYQIYDKPQDRLFQMLGRNRKQYREFWALRNISLDIRRGETVGIIGQNGSGKSTLLQMICGTVTPSGGTVQTHGRIAALLELGSGFNFEFTGRENVYLNGALLGLRAEEIDARFDEIADFAGIGDFMEQPVKTYSSGMTVRLAFAVSVCVEPEILVVDEALAVGDASFQFKCLNRLAALTEQGTTLLFVSHDLNMVRRFCNRVVYLRLGEVRAVGAPDEIAELYMLDLRDDQRRWATGDEMPVKKKTFVGGAEGFAFGTEEGRVLSACFTDSQDLYSSFVYGETIEIRVECLLNSNIQNPNISFTIQEMRLLIIGGGNFTLHPEPAENGWQKASITVRFRARLGAGRYHVTIKLLNGYTEETSHLIEKQVALLSFDALPGNKDFLGIFDFGLEQV